MLTHTNIPYFPVDNARVLIFIYLGCSLIPIYCIYLSWMLTHTNIKPMQVWGNNCMLRALCVAISVNLFGFSSMSGPSFSFLYLQSHVWTQSNLASVQSQFSHYQLSFPWVTIAISCMETSMINQNKMIHKWADYSLNL
jgi:hypothetical protein